MKMYRTKTDRWLDWVSARCSDLSNQILSGNLTHDQYSEKCAVRSALLSAAEKFKAMQREDNPDES